MKSITIDIDQPDGLPLSLETLKEDLRISIDDLDDVLMNQYIPDAVEWAEGVMHRSILSRTHRWILSCFPYGADQTIYLPRGKAQAVTSIAYVSGGVTTTLRGPSSGSPVGTDYQEDLRGHRGRILPNVGSSWPSVDIDVPSPVVITYLAGWDFEDVPRDIRRALTARVSDSLELPNSSSANVTQRDQDFAEKLLSAWRIP